ncbi:MAG: radical SAM protein [Ignavibacteria bacterium]|nr:radical SAM protein [Ignavibacteria bacterium]MDP3831011.1 radical SAM protein [Ignavibacteriaceae bacterium]
MFSNIKEKIISAIKLTEFGNRQFYLLKDKLGKNPIPDLEFPELLSLELSSICNLTCIHCPSHNSEFAGVTRKHEHINYDLFMSLMDEIDLYGKRQIALHKDGEPLIHPRIVDILERVKKNVPHEVYLSTNGLTLNRKLCDLILANRIDIVNFSIGAGSGEFYEKVRGKGFHKLIKNVHDFLNMVSESKWKPKVIVQIIELPEHQEMSKEIKAFKKYWKNFDVEIAVWKKLTWGVFENDGTFPYRYPCYSLWNSFNINSNGLVTACCIDWKQELVIGNVYNRRIKEIWSDETLKELRLRHINKEENEIDACRTCNYWKWQPMLIEYPL